MTQRLIRRSSLNSARTPYALYSLLVFLPVSGFTMGYFGGKGLPFFPDQGGTVFTPKSGEFGKAANGAWAKWAYQNHKLAGQALEYLVPLHIGAVGFHHIAKGQNKNISELRDNARRP